MAVMQYPLSESIISTSASTATTSATWTLRQCDSLSIILSSSSVSGTSPTLDVAIQTSPDGGTTYVTVARFTQQTAAAAEIISVKPYLGVGDAATSLVSAATGGVAKANIVWAKDMKILCTIGGTNPSFDIDAWVVYSGGQHNYGGI